MSDTAIHCDDPRLAFGHGQRDLRARIGWICHALRIAAVLWIIWLLAFVVYYWSDKAQILKNYELLFSIDLGDVSAARYAAAFAAVTVSLAIGAAVVVCIWRLTGTYLAGHVFTIDAALWLRRTGLRDESRADRIGDGDKNDRDGATLALQRSNDRRRMCKDHV
jgi:hypothetical protein